MMSESHLPFDRITTPIGKCTGPTDFSEWSTKIRQAVSSHRPSMLQVLDGEACPTVTV